MSGFKLQSGIVLVFFLKYLILLGYQLKPLSGLDNFLNLIICLGHYGSDHKVLLFNGHYAAILDDSGMHTVYDENNFGTLDLKMLFDSEPKNPHSVTSGSR